MDISGQDKPIGTRWIKHFWTTAVLVALGIVLGMLGAISIPVGMGVTRFWPAIVVQVCGGIWFGLWGGLVAGAAFPMLSNILIGGSLVQIFGFVPANAVQGLIPCWAFRHFGMPASIPGWRGLGFFAFWGCALPNLVGALIGPAVLVLSGELAWDSYPGFAWAWWFGNSVPAFLLGAPLLRYGSRMLEETRLLVKGAWV
ncbi:MAG TPA: hypothetical protein VL462_00560 [Candidatus Nitrosotalea sp.]|nr:hypothetical protein [Candidatus Nitrosotalea sp.]